MNVLVLYYDHEAIVHKLTAGLKESSVLLDVCNLRQEFVDHIYHHSYGALFIDGTVGRDEVLKILQKIRAAFIETPLVVIYNQEFSLTERMRLRTEFEAVFFLGFPFLYEELADVMSRIKNFSKDQTLNRDFLKVADLELNSQRHQAIRQNRKITLKNREFSLLKCLMEHSGMILTRTALVDMVWDRNADIFTNTVDVHINNLRKKIDLGFDRKLIHTVHGVGYMLSEQGP